MRVRALTIGDEILFGQVIDTNSAYLAKKLNEIGLEIIEIRSIQDQPKIIIETLEELVDKTDVLITTGGLGPTNDDLTKKSLCEFLKTNLVLNKEILNELEVRFKKNNRTLNALHRDQALVPKNSIALPNPLGTAPGIWTEHKNCIIINLPGVPFEMKNLLKSQVIPLLKARFSLPFVIHRFLSVSNFPESDLAIALKDWENQLPENFHLAYLPENSKVKLVLTAKGRKRDKLIQRIDQEVKKVIPILKNHLDSTQTAAVELILGKILKEKKLSISTAESCTGGYIAQLLTSVPGSSTYYKGSVVSYATEVKKNLLNVSEETIEKHTVVSKEVALEMAKGIRKKLYTDISLSTTGVAGPSKGEDGKEVGTVWIAIASAKKTFNKMYYFPYLERDDFIAQVSKLALQNVLEFVREIK